MPSKKLYKAYKTNNGSMFRGLSEDVLKSNLLSKYKGKVQLIFTSPPFPLNRKKKYGNYSGEEFVYWLGNFAPLLKEYLKPNGSIVMEMGNAWEPGVPVMSTLALRALLKFLEFGNLHLCEQFVWHNPARLPAPAEWVNIRRIRVKDTYTHIWWMAQTPFPKSSNRRVLKPYSKSMERLLETKKYNSGTRPSEHNIGEKSFLKRNSGAIPGNVLVYPNTKTNDSYQLYCRKHNINLHPARMPIEVAEFFVNFLTNKKDIVLDPFAGSNTTGQAAEILGRKWLGIEANKEYIRGSIGRFNNVKFYQR
jgi:site-specific DNA-methyltransferase (cytosine-N4-specific)